MMADPSYQFPQRQTVPHRKPVPHLQTNRPYLGDSAASSFSHSRSRTTSSSVFPAQPTPQSQMLYPNQSAYASRRTPSTGTFSTIASSGNAPVPNRGSTSTDLRRSTSSRSGNQQPTGYVALMRKQKATVWCDRAQHEDPRLLAAQRAARLRAAMEVSGGSGGRVTAGPAGSLAGSNRVTAKIRHGGKAGLVGYNPSENFGVGVGGVPMRLSASEVEGNDSDDDIQDGAAYMHHQRTGSGRSSIGSGRRGLAYGRQSGGSSTGRWSAGNTPPSERVDSLNSLAEETPMPHGHERSKDYFSAERTAGDGQASAGSGGSGSSGSSGERGDAVGELDSANSGAAKLASDRLLQSYITREKSVRNPEELRRRGSVDERTMTMSMGAGRLFVANPDMDSD